MNTFKFQQSKIALYVCAALSTGFTANVYANEASKEKEVEVIEVRGIKGSLMRSMNVKREMSGVVDAISAEEMGKFPDTNLAESLQRITGVSVSRSNGEGSQITVRGLGPEFNLLLLNDTWDILFLFLIFCQSDGAWLGEVVLQAQKCVQASVGGLQR